MPKGARTSFLQNTQVSKPILTLTAGLALIYFIVITFAFKMGNPILFWLLIAGEIFHSWMVFTYLWTVWDTEYIHPVADTSFKIPVDVFITVAGEPVDIVRETVQGAKNMRYDGSSFTVHILNDGFVAKKDNWKDIEALAKEEGVECITRTEAGGAKAGNINNAVSKTKNPLVVILDADHIPHPDFLEKTIPHFADTRVGFVQTPQFYKNAGLNYVTQSSWNQQELFFGPICKGKNRLNSATMCGTNMVIRREALVQAGGVQYSIAEDFLTGLMIHARGWKSVYVPEVLAEGLAPEDYLSYYKQQFRWARGAFDMILGNNTIFKRGITFKQRLQYLSSVSFYLSGLVVLMNAAIPLVFFFTGIVPFQISTMTLAVVFLPYIFMTLYTLQLSSNFSFTFSSLAFSMGSFMIHIEAFLAGITFQKSTFSVTSKRKVDGNFLSLVIPHFIYIALVFAGITFALYREGLTASVITNSAWALLNVAIFIPTISAALPNSAFSKKLDSLAPINKRYGTIRA